MPRLPYPYDDQTLYYQKRMVDNLSKETTVPEETSVNIANKKTIVAPRKKLTPAEYKKEYIDEAQKISLYGDPIPFPFLYSKGEGIDKVAVLPSPHLRIFLMGFEISSWITVASFSSDASPGLRESSNTFSLQCPNDLFTLTHDNVFLNSWNLNDDFRTSEQVKKAIYDHKKSKNVYEEKTLIGTWNLTVNNCIFHSADTVRIFSHIPWTEDDAWLPVFNGYVTEVQVASDSLTGRDTITFTLETISNKLNKARFLNNPYSIQVLSIADEKTRNPSNTIVAENLTALGNTSDEIINLTDNYAVYKDIINPTLYGSLMTNTTLERLVAFLFYGDIDLTYREENAGINSSLKDFGVPYEKLAGIKGNEEGKPQESNLAERFDKLALVSQRDFRSAYGSDFNSVLKPSLSNVVSRLQSLNSEKNNLQEKSKLQNEQNNKKGQKLFTNGDKPFYDSTWTDGDKEKSYYWKLKVLQHVINSTLQLKSVERKVKSERAQLKFSVGSIKKEGQGLAEGQAGIDKQGCLLGKSGSISLGAGYSYKDFNHDKEKKDLITITVEKNDYITNIEGLKTDLKDEEKDEPNEPAQISFKLKDGAIDYPTLQIAFDGSTAKNGKGRYYSNENEITIIFKEPENKDASISYVTDEFEFSGDAQDRYRDFLYKRGWGKLDPRLFALTREEFPRTGYPSDEIKQLTEAALKASLAKGRAGTPLSGDQIDEGLKEELIRQHALRLFLNKEGYDGADIKNNIKEIKLNNSTISGKFSYINNQWQLAPQNSGTPGTLGLTEPLGIPLIAFNEGGTPIEFYSGKFWFDEPLDRFQATYDAKISGLIYEINNIEIAKKFVEKAVASKSTDIKFKSANDWKSIEGIDTDKLKKAVFLNLPEVKIAEKTYGGLYVAPTFMNRVPSSSPSSPSVPTRSLVEGFFYYPILLFGEGFKDVLTGPKIKFKWGTVPFYPDPGLDPNKESIFFFIGKGTDTFTKLLIPAKFNIANNTLVATMSKNNATVEYKGIYQYIVSESNSQFLDFYKNRSFFDLCIEKYTSEDKFPLLIKSLFKTQEDKNKKFSAEGSFGFPRHKDKFSISFGGNSPQYSLNWNNNLEAAFEKLIFKPEDSPAYTYNSITHKNNFNDTYALPLADDNKFTFFTGPILSFSNNVRDAILYMLAPTKVPLHSPSYFVAWAIEAYNYYKNRTGFNDTTTLFKGDDQQTISTEMLTLKVLDPNPRQSVNFNLIKPTLKDDWVSLWNTEANQQSYWTKTRNDYNKNAKNNTQTLINLAEKDEILYTYKGGNFQKIFCIEEKKDIKIDIAQKNPYNIFELKSELNSQSNPSYNYILEQIETSDPNKKGGEKLEIVADGTFNLVAPSDGLYLGKEENENKNQIGAIHQFKPGGITESDATVHKFIFDKDIEIVESPIETLDNFNQKHKEAVGQILNPGLTTAGKNKKQIIDIQKTVSATPDGVAGPKTQEAIKKYNASRADGINTAMALKDFAYNGVNLSLADTSFDVLINRLSRIEPTLSVEYKKFKETPNSSKNTKTIFGYSDNTGTYVNQELLSKNGGGLFSEASLLNQSGSSAVGSLLSQVRPYLPQDMIYTGNNASLLEYNISKYDTINNQYNRLKDATVKYEKLIMKLLGTPVVAVTPNSSDSPKGLQEFERRETTVGSNEPNTKVAAFDIDRYGYRFSFYYNYTTKKWSAFINSYKMDGSLAVAKSGSVAYIETSNDTANWAMFIENLTVVATAAKNMTEGFKTDGENQKSYFKEQLDKLNQWYSRINESDSNSRTNGEIVDQLNKSRQENTYSALPSESSNLKGIRAVKKGQVLAKGLKGLTWEIYKSASNIPELIQTAASDMVIKTTDGREVYKTDTRYFTTMSPYAWLKQISKKDLTNNQIKQGTDNKEIDWVYEEYFMADWHKKCVVGFSNGIPSSSIENYNNEINSLDADAVDCLNAAKERLNPWLTYDEVTVIGNNSGWEGIYSPHGKTVTVALRSPKYGWGINGGLEPLSYQTIDFDTSTSSKGEILTTFMQRLDYYWYVNGNGDVIIDFPHYELIPSHYGPQWESFFQYEGLSTTITYSESFRNLKSTYKFSGGYGLINVGSQQKQVESSITAVFQLPNVLNRNGIDVEIISLPFITDKARLKLYGLIHVKKQVLNSFTIQMNDLPPILYLIPNTPIYHAERDIFALVYKVTFNWSITDTAITYKLQTGLTAIRQRLNYEQLSIEKFRAKRDVKASTKNINVGGSNLETDKSLENTYEISYDEFIKPEFSNDTRRIEVVSFYKNDTKKRTYSDDVLIKSNQVEGFYNSGFGVRLSSQTVDSLNPPKDRYKENDRLKQIQSNYGYTYGNRDPIIDYTAIYSSNQYVRGSQFQVLENQDVTYNIAGNLVRGDQVNKIVKKINTLEERSTLVPIVGQLKESINGIKNILGLSKRTVNSILEVGLNSVDIDNIADPETRTTLQNELNNANSKEAEGIVKVSILTVIMNEFQNDLKKRYAKENVEQNYWNPKIQTCLQTLGSYSTLTSPSNRNPALEITCGLNILSYGSNYTILEEQFLGSERFSQSSDKPSEREFLNAVSRNLSLLGQDPENKTVLLKIQKDLKTVSDLIKLIT